MAETDQRTPREDGGEEEATYQDIAREVQEGGFAGVSAADVADTHRRMQQGDPPSSIIDREIAERLRRRAARETRGPAGEETSA